MNINTRNILCGVPLGDISGQPYEGRYRKAKPGFPLISNDPRFSDDTVMTVAVADTLLSAGPEANGAEIRQAATEKLQAWGRKYAHRGYGKCFGRWIYADDPQPYGSYGNGSAMRVSPAGWLYMTLERTREVAQATAAVTHNDPEGIKVAKAAAR